MTTCIGTWKNVQKIKTISKEAGYTVLHELRTILNSPIIIVLKGENHARITKN